MVASGTADIAALDAVTAKMIFRWDWDAFAKDLRVIASTHPTPTLPFITANTRNAIAIRDALGQAIFAMSDADRGTLCLSGVATHTAETYLSVANPPSP